MNIDTDFIPVVSTTLTTSSTKLLTSSSETKLTETTEVTSISTESNEYPPGQKRETLIQGISDMEKDILIISLSGLCLLSMVLLAIIWCKWRKAKNQRIHEFRTLEAGSSVSLFNSSKMD